MLKKLIVFVLSTVMVFSLCACSSNEEEKKETTQAATEKETTAVVTGEKDAGDGNKDFKAVDVSAAGWKMSVENVQIAPELSNTSEVLGYSSASSTTFEKKADDGKTYVLIKMLIEKDGATENIQWKNMILTDADGKKYNRIDDSFIDSLTWMRISGTDLNFGKYEGWFAYEIPEEKAESGLTLSYSFASEKMTYKVN